MKMNSSQKLSQCIIELENIKIKIDRGNKDQRGEIENVKLQLYRIQLEMSVKK